MRILVTGSRHWSNEDALRDALSDYDDGGPSKPDLVVGDCPTGADLLTVEFAAWAWWDEPEIYYADWDNCTPACPAGHRVRKKPGDVHHPGTLDDYCPGAGPRRNAAMVADGADLCVAFPTAGSRGTWNCVRLAKSAGIPVRVVNG